MRAAVVHAFDQPLRVEEVAKPEPGPGQVVVKIETCGLCHTDIHAAHESFEQIEKGGVDARLVFDFR